MTGDKRIRGMHLVLANKNASGKAIALYSSGPNPILCLAELLLLRDKALKKYPRKRIEGFFDVVDDVLLDDWWAAYKNEADRRRLAAYVNEITVGGQAGRP